MLERLQQLRLGPRLEEIDFAERRELISAPAVQAAPLRRGLGLVDGLPARAEIENRSLDPRDEPQPGRTERGGEAASTRQPEELGEVLTRARAAFGERRSERGLLPVSQQ